MNKSDKNWKKIIELQTLREIESDIDLNEAAELLDALDAVDSEPQVFQIQHKQPKPILLYSSLAAAAVVVIAVIGTFLSQGDATAEQFAEAENIIETESIVQTEVEVEESWELPPGLNEYDLGL